MEKALLERMEKILYDGMDYERDYKDYIAKRSIYLNSPCL